MTVGGSHNPVSLKTSVCDLTCDILVGQTNDHAVLGGVVLVLVLNDKALPGVEVSFTFTAPAELDLEALKISFAFYHFDEGL